MRFMVIVKASGNCEAGIMPDEQFLAEMRRYNEALANAGILLAVDRLHPTSKGARVRFSGARRTVIDGPFAETKELVGGFWMWQVKSKEEAIEWVKRCPNPPDGEVEIEIREVLESDDFGPGLTYQARDQDRRGRAQAAGKT
jgi:hypothetical protein